MQKGRDDCFRRQRFSVLKGQSCWVFLRTVRVYGLRGLGFMGAGGWGIGNGRMHDDCPLAPAVFRLKKDKTVVFYEFGRFRVSGF